MHRFEGHCRHRWLWLWLLCLAKCSYGPCMAIPLTLTPEQSTVLAAWQPPATSNRTRHTPAVLEPSLSRMMRDTWGADSNDAIRMMGRDSVPCNMFPMDPDLACTHVLDHCWQADMTPGHVPYLALLYCHCSQWTRPIVLGLMVTFLGFLFLCLGLVSADYLAPNVSTLARAFRLPNHVATVTVMALCSVSSDVVTNVVTLRYLQSPDMVVGQLLGSALFLTAWTLGYVICRHGRSCLPWSQPHVLGLGSVWMFGVGVAVLGLLQGLGVPWSGQGWAACGLYAVFVAMTLVLLVLSNRPAEMILKQDQLLSVVHSNSAAATTWLRWPASLQVQQGLATMHDVKHLLRCETLLSRYHPSTRISQDAPPSQLSTSVAATLAAWHACRQLDRCARSGVKKRVRFADDERIRLPVPVWMATAGSVWEGCALCSPLVVGDPRVASSVSLFKVVKYHLFPVTSLWHVYGPVGKWLAILTWWPVLIFGLTIPVVASSPSLVKTPSSKLAIESPGGSDSEAASVSIGPGRWHHGWVVMVQLLLAPLLTVLTLSRILDLEADQMMQDMTWFLSDGVGVPVWALACLLGLFLAAWVPILSRGMAVRPPYYEVVCGVGILVALEWAFLMGLEVMTIIRALGIVFGIPDGLLGLTLLALGSSFANGYSAMFLAWIGQFAAAFSSLMTVPMTSLSLPWHIRYAILATGWINVWIDLFLSWGLVGLLETAVIPNWVPPLSVIVAFGGLLIVLGMHGILFGCLLGSQLSHWHGISSMVLYVLCIGASLVAERGSFTAKFNSN